MSFELAAPLHIFEEKETPFFTIESIARAGFRCIDFNFADWILVEDCPLRQQNWPRVAGGYPQLCKFSGGAFHPRACAYV